MVTNVAASQQEHQPASTMALTSYCQSCQRLHLQVRARARALISSARTLAPRPARASCTRIRLRTHFLFAAARELTVYWFHSPTSLLHLARSLHVRKEPTPVGKVTTLLHVRTAPTPVGKHLRLPARVILQFSIIERTAKRL